MNKPIEIKKVDDVMEEPYKLPESFEWSVLALEKDDDADELFTLLRDHYVEDDQGKFRF